MNCKPERLVRCGACNAKFATAAEFVEHIKTCPFAKVGTAILKQALDAGLDPAPVTPNAEGQHHE